jgi:membrane protein DedA with SNARE-associated domain
MLETSIKNLSEFLHHHPNYGQIFAFSIAFLESLPIIGTIVPGIITMSLIGSLIGSRTLPATSTFISIVVGALSGDFLGYYLGLKGQGFIKNSILFKRYHHLFQWGEDFFNKHGSKSLLIGRFVGPLRSTIPLIAGILKMPQYLFTLAIIPTAILWSLVYLTPGFLLGAYAIDIPHDLVVECLLYLSLATLLFLIIHKHSNIRVKCEQHALFWIRADHQHAIMNIVLCCFGFAIISYIVINTMGVTVINSTLYSFFMSLHTETLNILAVGSSCLGDKYSLAVVYLVIVGYYITVREYPSAIIFIACGLGCALCIQVIKYTVLFTRPAFAETIIQGPSYPSGHSAAIITLCMLMYSISPKNKCFKYIITALCIIIPLGRLYLGVHWFSDIVGGVLLGMLFGFLGSYLLSIVNQKHPKVSWIPIYLAAGMMASTTFAQYNTRSYYAKSYTPPFPEIQLLKADEWAQQKPGFLPFIRKSRFDYPISALNIQYAGALTTLINQLTANEWKTLPLYTSYNLLHALTHKDSHLPIIETLYLNQYPMATLYKETPSKKTYTIKLWRSQYALNHHSIYFGSISKQTLPYKWILSEPEVEKRARFNITDTLTNTLGSLSVNTIKINHSKIPRSLSSLDWDGKILLIDGRDQ